ncbi:MAG: polysaccharide pyruvyl transferase family protein [Bifidobacteriaceae bacterium]|jgi:hypothetical protein|nr:polysaccharide pyruvyl transferase family protein [Bifidobacteriaceae bacterium]
MTTAAPARGRVLIRTQPVGHNYGAVLQAYALQQVIHGLGRAVDIDTSQPPTLAGRVGRPYLAFKRRVWRRPLLMREVQDLIDAALLDFVDRRLQTVRLYGFTGRPDRSVVRRYTDFVTGSDQVWRPLYSDVPSYLFDFLPATIPGRRLSYAASFGTDDAAEYTDDLIARTGPLAARLDGVSVREASGVDLVKRLWDRADAQAHVDPTLLLPRERYDALAGQAPSGTDGPEPGGVVSYLLDVSAQKAAVAQAAADHLGVAVASLLRPAPAGVSAYLAAPETYRKLPVETWLAGIRDARLVVTDSFHGTVFSIIFGVPFVVIPNSERGRSRFDSLLRLFGLADRMVPDAASGPEEGLAGLVDAPIDWAAVAVRLAEEQARALAYLGEHLA